MQKTSKLDLQGERDEHNFSGMERKSIAKRAFKRETRGRRWLRSIHGGRRKGGYQERNQSYEFNSQSGKPNHEKRWSGSFSLAVYGEEKE